MRMCIAPVMLLALSASPALAHITANPDTGIAGHYFQTSFRVSHGCEKSDTVAVRIKIPDSLLSVHPQFKPGWKAVLKTRKLPQPVAIGHGKTTDEKVEEIVWTGGPLPHDQYDDFGLLMKLPETAGKTLWFPVTQVCESGETKWADIPPEGQEWHSLPTPAPFVKLTAGKP